MVNNLYILNCMKIVQIIMICLDMLFVVVMVKQKESRLSKLMLCIAFLGVVNNFGYLLELSAVNVNDAMKAVSVEYLGGAFIVSFVFLFAIEFCGMKMPKAIAYAIFSFDGIVLLSVCTYKFNPLFYSDTFFEMRGLIPHLSLQKGPLYIINAIKLCGMFFVQIVITIRTSFTTPETHKRASARLLAVCCGLPFWAFIINVSGVLNGYDPVPFVEALCIFVFGMTIVYQHVFDLASTAYENIIAEMQDIIVIVDKSAGYIDSNKSAKQVFKGLSYSKKDKKIVDERLRNLIETCIQKGISSTEYTLKDHIYEVHLSEIVNRRIISGYIVSMFDITEERKRLENMEQLKIAADKANRAKSEFLARMSHEIRSPINAVIGMNEMILRESSEDNIKEYASDVKNSANTLLSFVNDLLDSSKIESEKMTLVPVNYRLKTMIKDLYNMISVKAKEKDLSFDVRIQENLPSVLWGDDVRIKQILINILTNAVKYTAKGNIWFNISGDIKGGRCVIRYSVKDTGSGIKQENIPHLFDAYERVSVGKNRYIEGTGLGLNIASRLLALMDSELKVESVYGEGSRFYFDLEQEIVDDKPIGKVDVKQRKCAKEYSYKESFTAPDAKILVVDDNRINLRVFTGLLKNTKLQITCAKSGEECLEEIKKQKYDIIFLDHMMPQMDGLETFKIMQSRPDNKCKDTPVVMLTANATNGVREEYLKEGFDDFLAKPIDSKLLEEMIVRLLPENLVQYRLEDMD